MNMKWLGTYAGYSPQLIRNFTEEINTNYNCRNIRILEPMCGSGTLLVEFEKNNIPYVAYDINPAQVIQCKAKVACISDIDYRLISSDLKKIKFKELSKTISSREWYDADVVSLLTDLYNELKKYSSDKKKDIWDTLNAAFILTLRRNACITTSSNPTWLKKGGTIPGTNIKTTLFKALDFIVDWNKNTYKKGRLRKCGKISSRDVRLLNEKEHYDICITSPPYCNRMDYKRMLAPEYYFIQKYISNIKNDVGFIGDNVVRNVALDEYSPTTYETGLLKRIRTRQEPENKDYYYKYYKKYFYELDETLQKIMSALKHKGVLFITVQNSHYKDVEIHLDEVIMSKIQDRHLVSVFQSKLRCFFGKKNLF